MIKAALTPVIGAAALLGLWQAASGLVGGRAYLLPSPRQTVEVLILRFDLIAHHAGITAVEILLGLGGGVVVGVGAALVIALSPLVRRALLPWLVVSQAIPVFALAPLLVLWLGYGMASKVAMAMLVIFFPVTTAFLDGLRRTDPAWLDQAKVMGASPAALLWAVRLPAALPAFTSGLRVAAAIAPIGAVLGEWVGSSGGLGYLMLHANARMQIPLLFAALLVLACFSLVLFAIVDQFGKALVKWQGETSPVP